jgi:hypothetical protein
LNNQNQFRVSYRRLGRKDIQFGSAIFLSLSLKLYANNTGGTKLKRNYILGHANKKRLKGLENVEAPLPHKHGPSLPVTLIAFNFFTCCNAVLSYLGTLLSSIACMLCNAAFENRLPPSSIACCVSLSRVGLSASTASVALPARPFGSLAV